MENKKADITWDDLVELTEQFHNIDLETDLLEEFELKEVITCNYGYKRKFNDLPPIDYNNNLEEVEEQQNSRKMVKLK
jgi:hypothetical protein